MWRDRTVKKYFLPSNYFLLFLHSLFLSNGTANWHIVRYCVVAVLQFRTCILRSDTEQYRAWLPSRHGFRYRRERERCGGGRPDADGAQKRGYGGCDSQCVRGFDRWRRHRGYGCLYFPQEGACEARQERSVASDQRWQGGAPPHYVARFPAQLSQPVRSVAWLRCCSNGSRRG